MGSPRRSSFRIALVASLTIAALALAVPSSGAATNAADRNLQRALDAFVHGDDGSPGISAVVQRGSQPAILMTAGVADTSTKAPITAGDAMRLASVAKAFSGAAALSAVADGTLALDDTIGKVLPDQPAAWAGVTLAQLLQHVSGVPDFSASDAFREALVASLTVAPPPAQLLSYVADEPLVFPSGTKYEYSNSDNILVALMVAAVDGTPYEDSLTTRVYEPLRLLNTSLPAGVELPTPFIHGYQPDPPNGLEDVSEVVAAGWAWASGGLVSTPQDANRFIRGYASGKTTTSAVQAEQFRFRAGKSDPTGPGTNSAGLGIFRYRTRCGVMFGHTGNTAGFTQFVASTRDGKRSAVVSINAQITQKTNTKRFPELRNIFTLATCAALEGSQARAQEDDVEDRESPVLYLEMTEATPEDYARERVSEVRALPGVERATWWRNVYRDRPDLPRELPEFDTLGVYECTPAFVAPATPDGVTGHHFLRTPRPGQGRLTGKPTVSLSLVLISPTTPAEAQALRDWGDFVHLNHIVEAGIPGFTMITPYENVTSGDPRYMHFYEFDDPEAEITFKRMRPLVEARIGAWETPECQEWAMHPALRIMYVNSFSLVGKS